MLIDKKYSAVDMALAVLMERISSLPKEDRDDLYELVPDLLSMDDDQRESAATAVSEILEQSPGAVQRVELVDEGDELKEWISFVSGKIRELRKAAGLTQQQLAEESGLPQSHISRLENGEHSPSFSTLEKLAPALGVPVSELDPSA